MLARKRRDTVLKSLQRLKTFLADASSQLWKSATRDGKSLLSKSQPEPRCHKLLVRAQTLSAESSIQSSLETKKSCILSLDHLKLISSWGKKGLFWATLGQESKAPVSCWPRQLCFSVWVSPEAVSCVSASCYSPQASPVRAHAKLLH